MKKTFLKLALGASLLIGFTNVQAEILAEAKMLRHIVHGIPWVETRLAYAITVKELAQNYYGNSEGVTAIIKANKNIKGSSDILRKNMMVNIPVTDSFRDQPELLGWMK